MLKNVKNVLFVAALAVSSLVSAQITVKENPETVAKWSRGLGVTMVEVTKYSDNAYGVMYWDSQYTHITEYKSFMISSLDTFYDLGEIFKQQFKAKKNTELRIDVDGTSITIKTLKMLGVAYLNVYVHAPGEPMGVMMVDKVGMKKLFDN